MLKEEFYNGIKVEEIPENELKKKYEDESKIGFGRTFTDRMFYMEYKEGSWQQPVIKKYENLSYDPAAKVFHYAQEIFEGMKAFHTTDGHINLFRPDMNVKRFNNSAKRMKMPEIDPDLFLQSISKLVELERDWIPKSPGTSFYVRPTYIGVTPTLDVHPSTEYAFYVILSPSGSYFAGGYNPVKIYVQDTYVRAVRGGTGDAKTGGNYGGSLLAGEVAAEHGCSQVLWLDALHLKYVEEVGSMNVFFVKDGTLYTSPLTNGTILPGVTRDSTIQLAKDAGYAVKEEALAIDDVITGVHNGSISEVFGAGTAAAIVPVGSFYYKGEFHEVNGFKTGKVTEQMYDDLTGIQTSRKSDPYGWIYRVC